MTRERVGGSFRRQLSLGDGIDVDNIAARYTNGVLSVVLPVSERAKPRKIEVTAGDDDTILEGDGGNDRVAP